MLTETHHLKSGDWEKNAWSAGRKSCREQFPSELSAAAAEKTADSPEKTTGDPACKDHFSLCRKKFQSIKRNPANEKREPKAVWDALQKSSVSWKIRRRIELQNPNERENQAELKKVISDIRYQISCLKSEKKNSRGKSEPDTSSNKAVSGCRCTFLLLIFVTHTINEIGNVTFKKEKNGKNLHPPITFFLKKNVISDIRYLISHFRKRRLNHE